MWDNLTDEFSTAFSAVPPGVAAVRLVLSLLLAGIIGFEREYQGKAAGLRTHMLVALAACLFVLVGETLATTEFGADSKRVDPIRLIEAVTAGVAFLAAGLIFTSGGEVKNITTGASLWLAGAIGLACGVGQAPLAAMATAIIVIILWLVGWAERRHRRDPD